MFGGPTVSPPAGWLLCNGQAVSRTSFSSLFASIGVLYGVGDGSTTFNLPDYRDSFPRGAVNDAARGTTGGVNDVTLTGPQSGIAAHDHNFAGFGADQTPLTSGGSNRRSSGSTNLTLETGPTTAASSHENRPPFQDINFLIHV